MKILYEVTICYKKTFINAQVWATNVPSLSKFIINELGHNAQLINYRKIPIRYGTSNDINRLKCVA